MQKKITNQDERVCLRSRLTFKGILYSLDPCCNDRMKNQDESDIDCGGLNCPKCPDMKNCISPNDCLSGVCINNTCIRTCFRLLFFVHHQFVLFQHRLRVEIEFGIRARLISIVVVVFVINARI